MCGYVSLTDSQCKIVRAEGERTDHSSLFWTHMEVKVSEDEKCSAFVVVVVVVV